MRVNRSDALGVLQWQNSPRPGSVDFNNLKAAERQAASAQKNHIRENIRRVRSLTVTGGQQNPSRRGIGLPDTKMNIFERYLADLDNAAGQPQEISPDHPTHIPEDRKVTKTVQTQDEDGTINSAISDQAAQTGETEHSPQTLHTPSLRLVSTEKRSGFLKAHEKTGQLDTMMVLSEIPVKPTARTANPERLHVPTASSAKDIQFIRRDLNYIRANANAVTYGQVRNQRPTSEEDLKCENSRPSVTARSNLGKLPCYLIRRRKEEQAKKAELARSKDEREGSALTPPGHRRVSEDERMKTLAALQEAHANALSQLQGLPIHMSTTRVRNRRQELENRLSELEEAINIFRKPIVYIKLD